MLITVLLESILLEKIALPGLVSTVPKFTPLALKNVAWTPEKPLVMAFVTIP